jgi:hypothetical protein
MMTASTSCGRSVASQDMATSYRPSSAVPQFTQWRQPISSSL